MSGLDCIRIRGLVHRHRVSLSDAERLRIERHLEGCVECARSAFVLEAVRDLIEQPTSSSIGSSGHERAIADAFADAARPVGGRPVRGAFARRRWLAPALGLGALATAGIAWVVVTLPSIETAPESVPAITRDGGRVIAGNVRVDRRPLATGDVFPSGAEVSSEEGASLRVGRAEVALGVGARVSWSEEAGTLTLASGAVDLEVEPANGVALRVVTRRFIVEVVGTSFHVDEEGVRVARGVVRVLDRDRGELLARLGAGEAWRVDGAGERERPAAIEASRDEPPARVSGRRVAPPGDPEAVLEEGRHALARGDVGAAEAAARTVLATRAADRHAAEAEILLAECEQVSGRPDAAARRYLGISERYPNVAAAESALFAAARLRANAGDSDGARALLRAYLERYPSGRFERDVAARLSVLERSQP